MKKLIIMLQIFISIILFSGCTTQPKELSVKPIVKKNECHKIPLYTIPKSKNAVRT